jgi:hypothetical protein
LPLSPIGAHHAPIPASVAQGQSSCFVNSRPWVQIPPLAPHPALVALIPLDFRCFSLSEVRRPPPFRPLPRGHETPSVHRLCPTRSTYQIGRSREATIKIPLPGDWERYCLSTVLPSVAAPLQFTQNELPITALSAGGDQDPLRGD